MIQKLESLTLISLQHELAMAIGSELHLEPLLQHFLKACSRRLGLSAAYVYMNLNDHGFPVMDKESSEAMLNVFTSFPRVEATLTPDKRQTLHEAVAQLVGLDGGLELLEHDGSYFYLFALDSFGCLVLEKQNEPINSEVVSALAPIARRLTMACIASIEYAHSLDEVEKRRAAENAHRESEVRLRSVLDNVVDGIITINEEGMILSFNAAAERMFGYSLEEALGHNILELLPDAQETSEFSHINLFKFQDDDYFRGFGRELTGRRKDGTRFPMDWAVSEFHVEGQRLFTAIARDITQRRKVEESLKEQLRYANAITQLTEVMLSENSPQAILHKTASVVGQALHVDRMIIVNVDCVSDEAINLSEWLNPLATTPVQSTTERFDISIFANTVAAILSKGVSWVESHEDEVNELILKDNLQDFLHKELHVKSLLYYPFWFSAKGFYVLAFNQVEYRRQWHEDDISFINAVAQHISVALKKVSLLLDREKQAHDLKLAATAFETREAILIADKNSIIQRVNKSFTRITGYSSEEVLGKTPRILKSGRQSKLFYQKMWAELYKVGYWQGEIWNKRKSGEIYPEWQTITAVRDEQGEITHFVATFQDITERKRNETRIKHLAYYDELTGLPNRSLLTDRLRHELAVAKRRGSMGAIMFIDLDRFKTINDSLGHPTGDLILQQIAKRLQSHVRGEDTVARLGGDEFVILLPGVGKDAMEANHAVKTVAEKLSSVIGEPYDIDGHQYHLTPSVGVVLFPEQDEDVNDILKHADTAMYRAKAAGRNSIRFYMPSMQEAVDERLALEKDLRHSIARGELCLFFQPQVDSQGRIVGSEALIRWRHPTRGMVPPDQFIGIAEETGQIFEIGDWVLRSAVAQISAWREQSLKGNMHFVAVNVSPRQFHQVNFVQNVISILEESGVPPRCMKLEITEGIVMADVQDAIDKMAALKAIGVRFAIDDFGTGYSSMAYLKRLPLDQLKIDKSFVQDISTDPNDAAIVETIIAMARHLGLDVVAEGVETEQELRFLQAQGCESFQGYYFSRPLPISEFTELLRCQAAGERLCVPAVQATSALA